MEVSASSSSEGVKEAEGLPTMPQQASTAEPDAEGGELSSSSSLSSSTNWVVDGGLLRDSIAFDTYESIAGPDNNLACPKGSVILKAPGDEPPPCEVNVCFSQKHEIHRVYVKSTARVFEMYYALEEPIKNNEYLCTVRCGEAGETSLTEFENGFIPANLTPGTISPTNNNDEDGWVEVKIGDSSGVRNSDMVRNVQTFYEATAEVTDVNPCISLTLRLLSLHEKGSIQIAEIYVCADPVPNLESSCMPFNMANNLAGSSLFSMFVPGLFPLQKPEGSTREIFEKFRSGAVIGNEKYNPDLHTPKQAHIPLENSSKMSVQSPFQVSATTQEAESSLHVPHYEHYGETNWHVPQHVPHSGETNKHAPEQNEVGCSHTESILSKLVSRIDAIESICIRIEEKMMKPLSSIETRLAQLEQQLGVLTARSACHEQLQSSRIAAPEFSCDTSESGENGGNDEPGIRKEDTSSANTSTENVYASSPGLVVRAPDFVPDDESVIGCNDNSWPGQKSMDDLPTSVAENDHVKNQNENFGSIINLQEDAPTLASKGSLQDDSAAFGDVSVLAGNRNGNDTGTFSVDCVNAVSKPSVHDDSVVSCDVPASTGNNSNDTVSFSIDCALTAALEAFLSSSRAESSKHNSQADKLQDESDKHIHKNQALNPAESIPCHSDIQQLFSGKIGGKGIMDFISFGASYEDGEKCFGSSRLSENSADESHETTGEIHTQSEQADGTSDHLSDHTMKSHSDENKQIESNGDKDDLNPEGSYGSIPRKNCMGESSSDSLVDGITTDHIQVIWSDGSSAYSEEEVFPLPKWLAGRLGTFESHTENAGDTEGDGHPAIRDSAFHDFSKSNLETKTVTNPLGEYEGSILDVEFTSEKVGGGSYFQDLLGEASTIETRGADCKESDQDAESASWSSAHCAVDLSDLSSIDHQLLVDITEATDTDIRESTDTEVVNQDSLAQANGEPFPSLI